MLVGELVAGPQHRIGDFLQGRRDHSLRAQIAPGKGHFDQHHRGDADQETEQKRRRKHLEGMNAQRLDRHHFVRRRHPAEHVACTEQHGARDGETQGVGQTKGTNRIVTHRVRPWRTAS
jgi:hypothetical protein